MTVPRNPDPEAAVQYLIWALEEIERRGNQKTAQHARLAIEALRVGHLSEDEPAT
jgi:hypothetical protein